MLTTYEQVKSRFMEALASDSAQSWIRAVLLVVILAPVLFWMSRRIRTGLSHRFSGQVGLVAGKVVLYGGIVGLTVMVMNQLGFELAPLLGAAGIVGVALGFASQTSVANLVSGLFLIGERSFQIGDVITVGDITGDVLSIDLLSVKIRTFDNKMVRIPNDTIIKTNVTNLSGFPIRRVDLGISVAYREDLARVKEVLLDIARHEPEVLMEPEPVFNTTALAASSVDIVFGVWAERVRFLEVRNRMYDLVLKRFREENIEIPFPHLSLYAGSQSEPIPVRQTS